MGYPRIDINGIRINRTSLHKLELVEIFDGFYREWEMKLDVTKDRKEINKIIENVLPLMIKNKNLTQECADCIILYFIEKMEKENISKNKKHSQNTRRSS